jgi:hypothetical protein
MVHQFSAGSDRALKLGEATQMATRMELPLPSERGDSPKMSMSYL